MSRPCERLRPAGLPIRDPAPGLAAGTLGNNAGHSVSQAGSRPEPPWTEKRATSKEKNGGKKKAKEKERSGYWHVVWTLDWFASINSFLPWHSQRFPCHCVMCLRDKGSQFLPYDGLTCNMMSLVFIFPENERQKWFAPLRYRLLWVCLCGRQTHRATFVAKFTMAKQAFALLYAWVFLSIIQIFQLIDIVLTFWLSFLHVDVSQHSLNNAYLEKRNKGSINTKCHLIDSIWKPTVARCVFVLTACSRLAVSGWSGGVCLKISFRRRGYLTNRERGMSKKLHKSSFLLKGDSRQRCKKSWTLGSCFFWSSKAFAANWLLQ